MTKTSKQITLSPEAAAALKLPLEATGTAIYPADSTREIFTVFIRGSHYRVEHEIAAFIAALVNAALVPESNTELAQQVAGQLEVCPPGVPMCHIPDCLNGAEPGYIYCTAHMRRWTIEDIMRREG